MGVIHLNELNFEEVINSDLPVIIDFWASWCGPCQMMGPVFEELSSEYKGKLNFAKLNVDENPELANKFNVQGIPSLIILKNNQEIERIVGFNPKEVLREKIDALI
jgi:thioredoxin 1